MPCDTDFNLILKHAIVPEHSPRLMRALSGGEPLAIGPWVFYAASDWLMAIGYPLYKDNSAFTEALEEARAKTGAVRVFAIAPSFPKNMSPHILEEDRYYVMSPRAKIPKRLLNYCEKAASRLTTELSSEFTAGHRKLWGEFIAKNAGRMNDRVRELYARAPLAMAEGQLRSLDARDEKGDLVASLLIDTAPANFISYIIGAHSSENYVPHASDLLFSRLMDLALEENRKFIHLGLGVNEGIARFKKKWGAKPSFPYYYAEWIKEKTGVGKQFIMALTGASAPRRPVQPASGHKPYAMLWKIRKGDAVSWLGGTAHFFCYRFEYSFRKLFKKVDNVLFEGPLDADFMGQVAKAGKALPKEYVPLIDLLDEGEIRRLEKVVYGPRGKIARLLNLAVKSRVDAREVLRENTPWSAFFTLWTAYLERAGWSESVDMEAWRVAKELDKNIVAMETLEEQLESLGSLPLERVSRFLRSCEKWPRMARMNRKAYLSGDLERMMGSSAEFPTRTEHVIGRRDERFRQRMRPWLEKGRSAVFVGTAHLVNIRHMLIEDGFSVVQKPFGIYPKLHLKWRDLTRPDSKVIWQI